MEALILAAGYATRLHPLTLTKAKPLLDVAGKPMIEFVIDALLTVPDLSKVYIVTNAKFANDFEAWAAGYQTRHPKFQFVIVNDGSTDDSNKLGAIGDMRLVILKHNIHQDLLVIAGDNLFDTQLDGFVRLCRRKNAPVVGLYDVLSMEIIKKYGNVATDAAGRLTHFEEKPAHPRSTLAAIALYFYPQRTLQMIETYIREGNNPDQPGRFIQWLYTREPVFTYVLEGKWYDIGSLETLEQANRAFAQLKTH